MVGPWTRLVPVPRRRPLRSDEPDAYDFGALEAIWTVAEAKSRLSEVLRRAREVGPQQIGTQQPHVVVPLDRWLARVGPERNFGAWLVENAPRGCEFELPSREDSDREIPFAGPEGDE